MKIEKKIQKIKKPFSVIIFSQNGIRWAKKEKKKFNSRIPFILDLGKKIPKKIAKKIKKLKNHFPTLFFPKMGWRRPRKRDKNFSPEFCSNPTRARKFQKKKNKKIQKIKKLNSGIISIQNRLREVEKERKQF